MGLCVEAKYYRRYIKQPYNDINIYHETTLGPPLKVVHYKGLKMVMEEKFKQGSLYISCYLIFFQFMFYNFFHKNSNFAHLFRKLGKIFLQLDSGEYYFSTTFNSICEQWGWGQHQ